MADTKDTILHAAEVEFARYGYEGARVERIARAAGVQKPHIYYYFDGKRALYDAVGANFVAGLIRELEDHFAAPDAGPWERLDAFVDLLFAAVKRQPELINFLMAEMLHPPREDSVGGEARALLEGIQETGKHLVAEGIAAGAFRDQDPSQVVISLEGVAFYYFLLPEDRVRSYTGADKMSAEGLERRREHLREHLRRLLER